MSSSLLLQVSRAEYWRQITYKKLEETYGPKTSFRKWSKFFHSYYVDYFNTHLDNKFKHYELVKIFAWKTSILYHTNTENILKLFTETLTIVNKNKIPLISTDELCKKVPEKLAGSLIEKAGYDEFEQLVLRYSLMGFGDGLFLSIDREVYEFLEKSSKLPVLEGFASPFNHNLSNYCSLFHQDETYGGLGPYEEYIEKLTIPVRLCLNPPYVNNIIATCIEKLINYMTRYRGEFIMMVPVVQNFFPLETLLTFGNTRHNIMEPGSHTLHNFIQEQDIVAPIKLYIICNIGGSADESQRFANDISFFLRKKSCKIK